MNKRILILIIVFFFYSDVIKSKIIRKHKHPGSSQSSHTDIEIEPLTKPELKEDIGAINLDSKTKDDKTKNDKEEKIQNNEQKEKINKQSIPPKYYREDDEFVYETNDDNKNDIPLNLDEEIKRRDTNQIPNPNPNNMYSYNANNNNNYNNNQKYNIPNVDPEIQRKSFEQRKRVQNHYNPRPHQQKVINPDNLNHGRYPGTPPPGQRPEGGQTLTPETSNQPSKLRKGLSLIYQIMMIFFVVSFGYNYFLGKNQNDKHALVWYNANKEYFKDRYDYFGVEDDDELKKPKNYTISLMRDCKLIKENPYYYKLTCAYYRHIHYLTVVLEFHKRYDMTSILSSIFISPKDRLVFQVSFEPTENVGWIFFCF